MTKKPMTWIDVVKEQLAKLRKEGKSPSIGDVTPAARKEWDEIKSGKHPLYSQGSSKGKKRSSSSKQSKGKQGKNKTQKMHVSSNNTGEAMDHRKCIEQMLAKVHLCKKDVGKIHKYLKTMKMQNGGGQKHGGQKHGGQKHGGQKGGDCGCSQSGGSGSCSSCQAGGKGKKGRRTMKLKKGKKGKKSMKGGEAHEQDTNDNTEEKDSFVSAVDEETGEYGSGEAQKVAIVRDED